MPSDNDPRNEQAAGRARSIFSVPAPIKRLFDRFPLLTYPSNELPQRSPSRESLPTLYIFTTEEDAEGGQPSFNPTCLKWQTYLRLCGVEFRTLPSNNHSSPTGSLPFLLPPAIQSASPSQESLLPIPSNKLERWVRDNITQPSAGDKYNMRCDAYMSLLDNEIRNAWLYYLYLERRNSVHVAGRLYVTPSSTNTLVRKFLSHQLYGAAEAELLKHPAGVDSELLYKEAERALEALSTLLGSKEWFFEGESPSLFDASVFAYTHLLLQKEMGWREDRLIKSVQRWKNLVRHRERILDKYPTLSNVRGL